MNCKKILTLLLIIFLSSCTVKNISNLKITNERKPFINKGFALIYDDFYHTEKIISKKIDDRSLIVFQKNLKKGTLVKIKNLINDKTIIGTVGVNAEYPQFNNAIISKRIAKEIEINKEEPYIEIYEIISNSSFIAKKAKTFEAEKKVANKAPIDSISVNDLNTATKETKTVKDKKFSYTIKIADFYYLNSAISMTNRIKRESTIKKVGYKTLSKTLYRVFLGPFDNINSLQLAFNDIKILNFENIEIIKND